MRLFFTFHWPISVMGHTIRQPPPIRAVLDFISLLKQEMLVIFFEGFIDWSGFPLISLVEMDLSVME